MLNFYQDDAKEWRWRVRANNGRIVAESGEGYKEKRKCLDGARVTLALLQAAEQEEKL